MLDEVVVMIYLDNAATANRSSIDDIIVNTMTEAMREHWQNPSSLYATDVKEKINKCRANIAKFIGAKSDEIYFTSGASEANNWAIRGWLDEVKSKNLYISPVIITTHIEHKSLKALFDSGLYAAVRYCDIDEFGFVDCKSLKRHLSVYRQQYKPILVSIGLANNEVGTIQPIQQISSLVHKYGGILHVDATQAVGHIPIDVDELGIDLMSVSGHKISPVLKGIGFLYKRNGINIQPLIYGNQELGLRGGTENTFGIIGLSKAIDYCDVSQEAVDERCKIRNYFINLLESKFDCELNGDSYYRLPNNINVTFPQNITGEALLYTLDLSGIQISVGSACNSQSIEPSYVLKTIGLSDEDAMKTIRITLSDDVAYGEIDFVVDEIDKTIKLIEIQGGID